MTNDVADLQAQIVALRLAVEGAWISLLSADHDPAGQAERMGRENEAAVRQLDASTPGAQVMRDAVGAHTRQLWGSITWQLGQAADRKA